MKYILFGFIIFLAAFGLTYTLSIIYKKLISRYKIPDALLIIPLCGHIKEAENFLRTIIEKIRWENNYPKLDIILADMGLDKESRNKCELICGDYGFEICNKEDILSEIEKRV